MTEKKETWYTVRQIAEKVQCSQDLVYRAIQDGSLPATRFGKSLYRISPKDFQSWVEKMKFKPENE